MTRRLGFLVLGLGLGWACTDEEKPPPPSGNVPDAGEAGDGGSGVSGSSVGGSSTGGSSGRSGGGQGGTQGGAAGAAGVNDPGGMGGEDPGGSGGTSGTGGIPPCPASMEPPSTLSSVCDPEGALGPAMGVTLPDAAAALISITPDELTIAWTSSTLMGETYYVADRASSTDTFGAGQQLLNDVNFAALSPDGLRFAVLSPDGRTFSELTRTARGSMFGAAAQDGTFSTLNADANASGLVFAGCVISSDDQTLYYLVRDGADEQPLRVSRRTGTGPWPVGSAIEACEFQSHGDLFSVPTGVSSDGLTLFFYDYARAESRAAWRATADGPFTWFTDLGTRERAQPNTACSRLYYTSESGPAFSAIN